MKIGYLIKTLLFLSFGFILSCASAVPKYSVHTTSSYLERIWVTGIEFGTTNIPVGGMGNTGTAVTLPYVPIPKTATVNWATGKKGSRQKFSKTVTIPHRPAFQGNQNAYEVHFDIRGDNDVFVKVVPIYLIPRRR